MMKLELPLEDIGSLLIKQLDSIFSLNGGGIDNIEKSLSIVLRRVEENFSHSNNKYYNKNGETYFNPFHSGQYSIFLYYMAREIAHPHNDLQRDSILADKVYYLNKVMNSVDLFYEIELPDHFGVEHPLGSVMGRAKFGDEFFFYQGCTVGGNHLIYPTIGNRVTMYANSSIIGNCHIGDNVSLGAGCLIKDQDIPSNSLVFGQSPNIVIKTKKNQTNLWI